MKPCRFDHNGECLICDCWPSDCQYDRLMSGEYKDEEFEKLVEMFKEYLTEEDINGLRKPI